MAFVDVSFVAADHVFVVIASDVAAYFVAATVVAAVVVATLLSFSLFFVFR